MQPSEPYPQGSLVLHHLECTIDCHNGEQMELTAGSITSYMSQHHNVFGSVKRVIRHFACALPIPAQNSNILMQLTLTLVIRQ